MTRCPSCELMAINGMVCHETGCPDSHLFCTTACKWCGAEFQATERRQEFCDDDCYEAFTDYNL